MAGVFGRSQRWERGENAVARACAFRRSEGGAAAALGDDVLEESLGSRRERQYADGRSAHGLTEDRHARGIAAKMGNVGPDPLKGGDHIAQSIVSGYVAGRLGIELGVREEAQCAAPVIEADQYDTHLRKMGAVVERDARRPIDKAVTETIPICAAASRAHSSAAMASVAAAHDFCMFRRITPTPAAPEPLTSPAPSATSARAAGTRRCRAPRRR